MARIVCDGQMDRTHPQNRLTLNPSTGHYSPEGGGSFASAQLCYTVRKDHGLLSIKGSPVID